MGRAAEPAEIADVITFLAGHDSRFVTGVVLPIDGTTGQQRAAPAPVTLQFSAGVRSSACSTSPIGPAR
jgi:hypothetical protein